MTVELAKLDDTRLAVVLHDNIKKKNNNNNNNVNNIVIIKISKKEDTGGGIINWLTLVTT